MRHELAARLRLDCSVNAAAKTPALRRVFEMQHHAIVILRHEGNLLTVYVGVSDVSVAKGATVKRGQAIGKVAAGDPAFLHFEVRNTSKESFDPMTYLQ